MNKTALLVILALYLSQIKTSKPEEKEIIIEQVCVTPKHITFSAGTKITSHDQFEAIRNLKKSFIVVANSSKCDDCCRAEPDLHEMAEKLLTANQTGYNYIVKLYRLDVKDNDWYLDYASFDDTFSFTFFRNGQTAHSLRVNFQIDKVIEEVQRLVQPYQILNTPDQIKNFLQKNTYDKFNRPGIRFKALGLFCDTEDNDYIVQGFKTASEYYIKNHDVEFGFSDNCKTIKQFKLNHSNERYFIDSFNLNGIQLFLQKNIFSTEKWSPLKPSKIFDSYGDELENYNITKTIIAHSYWPIDELTDTTVKIQTYNDRDNMMILLNLNNMKQAREAMDTFLIVQKSFKRNFGFNWANYDERVEELEQYGLKSCKIPCVLRQMTTGDLRKFFMVDSVPKTVSNVSSFLTKFLKGELKENTEDESNSQILEKKKNQLHSTRRVSRKQVVEEVLKEGKDMMVLFMGSKLDRAFQILMGNVNMASLILKRIGVTTAEIVYYDVSIEGEAKEFKIENAFRAMPSLFFFPAFDKGKPHRRLIHKSAGEYLDIILQDSDIKENLPQLNIRLSDYENDWIYDGKDWDKFDKYFMKKFYKDFEPEAQEKSYRAAVQTMKEKGHYKENNDLNEHGDDIRKGKYYQWEKEGELDGHVFSDPEDDDDRQDQEALKKFNIPTNDEPEKNSDGQKKANGGIGENGSSSSGVSSDAGDNELLLDKGINTAKIEFIMWDDEEFNQKKADKKIQNSLRMGADSDDDYHENIDL